MRLGLMGTWVLTACTSAPMTTEPIPFCDGATEALYDPMGSDELLAFPDDWLTRPQADSPTGLVVDMTGVHAPWADHLPDLLAGSAADLDGASGFGRNGGVVFRFTGPVAPPPETAEMSVLSGGFAIFDLSMSPPTRVPFEASVTDDGAQVILDPLVPFTPGARHLAVVTTEHLDAPDPGGTEAAHCIGPSAVMRDILSQTAAPPLDAQSPRLLDALAQVEVLPEAVSAAVVFTVQDDQMIMVDVARSVAESTFEWSDSPTCVAEGVYLACTGTVTVADYRDDRAILTPAVTADWTLPVDLWLPVDLDGPVPVVMYGHGINGRRGHGSSFARELAPLGMAVVAVDALFHGEHPTADPDDPLPALSFLGVDLLELQVDPQALRGNFDQSAADRLQVLELLRQHPDIDGDGFDDIDASHMMYLGVSLGGMMGPELLALTDLKAGVLHVAGGDLMTFTTDTAAVKPFRPLIDAIVGSEARMDRLLSVAQSGVDAADPASWGAHVLHDRFDELAPPDVLFPVAVDDDTVPASSGRALARALGIDHVAPVAAEVSLLTVIDAPVSANLGDTTAGYFQFDRVTQGAGVAVATHDNTPFSPEGMRMTTTFLTSHLEGSTEIIDPYEALGTPPLP